MAQPQTKAPPPKVSKKVANFRVDPSLTQLLGQGYKSSEYALKELIDNAWDAEAENVFITLPNVLTNGSIVIQDDGTGMTDKEVREHYLVIANSRFSRKGSHTSKGRPIKGRKGIGKFAGLLAADRMILETKDGRGKASKLQISKPDLLKTAGMDLEELNLPLTTDKCRPSEHGTTVTLSELSQSLTIPTPERLKQILVLEYGREKGFKIWVNGVTIGIEDIPGKTFTKEIEIPGKGKAKLTYTVADSGTRLKQSGIAVRVSGKIVGKPLYFGLDQDEAFPEKLCKKVYGEIEADGLVDSVNAGWDEIIENSSEFQELAKEIHLEVREKLSQEYAQFVNLAKARLQLKANRELESLPEHKQQFAKAALDKVFNKFYGEDEGKFDTLISVVISAFERDEYFDVLEKIDEAKHGDVEALAEALNAFGVLDTANIAKHTIHRLKVLDDIDALISNDGCLESAIHHALEQNLWIFEGVYSMVSSNRSLKNIIEDYTQKGFTGDRATRRPDLFLAATFNAGHLLIEFKRPSLDLTRDHERQALEYRDALAKNFSKISILVLGRGVDPSISLDDSRAGFRFLSYVELISTARTRLDWLVKEIS